MLSKDDLALYDRQIRLWGVEAQQSIRKAVIMIDCGASVLSGAAQECIKNLCLSGVQEIRLNSKECSKESAMVLFGSYDVDAVINQAQSLNPSVKLLASGDLDGVSLMVHVGGDSEVAFTKNEEARQLAIPSVWLNVAYQQAILMVDFGPNHNYRYEQKKLLEDKETFETLTHATQVSFVPWREAWNVHLTRNVSSGKHSYNAILAALQHDKVSHVEDAPVNAIMGALASQEVIKGVTGKDCPIVNTLCFDGNTLEAKLLDLHN